MAFNTTRQAFVGTLGVNDVTADIILNPAVDWTRAYFDVTVKQGATSVTEELAWLHAEPINGTTLRITRDLDGETCDYSIEVIEFAAGDGVTVSHTQRTPGTYTIPAVDLTKTIVKSTVNGTVQCRNYPRVYLVDSTTLEVDGIAATHSVQQITFASGVEVRHGTFSATGLSRLVTISPAIDIGKAVVLTATETDSGQIAAFQRNWNACRFNSSTEMEFLRTNSASLGTCWWTLVIFDDTPVAHAELNMNSGDGVHNYSGLGNNAVNWPGGNPVMHHAERSSTSSQNHTGYIHSERTAAEQYTYSRASSATNATMHSHVVGWGEGGAPPTGNLFRNPNLDGIGAGGPFFADPLAA